VPRLIDPVLPAGTLRAGRQPTLPVGDGLVLRPWQPDDVPAVAAAYDDPAIRHWHHRSMTLDEAGEWVTATAHRWSQETDVEWAVCAEGAVAGRAALRGIDLTIGQAQVSYWTLPHARGRGIASAAVARVAAWALDEVGFWRLEIRHSTGNPGSCRVAARAGFRHEASLARQHLHADGWHDVHVHRRLRDEP
jgi:RimJ/RimL family protein N-acetyltransferase